MDSLKIIKKAVKWILIVFGSLALLLVIYIEVFLIKSNETGFGDIVSVVKVNFGSDYVVLSTSGSGAKAYQQVMFKSREKMKIYLSNHGCSQTYQSADSNFEYTKGDRKFNVTKLTDVPGDIYTTYRFEGITVEEINGK